MNRMAVFLGNPGLKYVKTRHNVAWLLCSWLNPEGTWQNRFHSLFLKQGEVLWLKPETFMNESGTAVQAAASYYNIPADCILVVHDDIELDFGKVNLRTGGGLEGHNGLRSVKQHLGTSGFARLRIGTGRPCGYMDVAGHVLSSFSREEEEKLGDVFSQAAREFRSFTGALI